MIRRTKGKLIAYININGQHYFEIINRATIYSMLQ